MSGHRTGVRLPGAVLAMEGVALYPLVVTWVARPGGWPEPLQALAALGLLGAGHAAASTRLSADAWRGHLAVATLAALALRWLVAGPAGGVDTGGALTWLAGALFPVAVAVACWWRGKATVDAELSPDSVRTEFAALGGVLIVVLGVFGRSGGMLRTDGVASGVVITLFLLAGLTAMTFARQEEAGAPRSRNGTLLAGGAAALFVISGATAPGLSRPEVLAALSSAATLLGQAVLLLLTPLVWLLSLLFGSRAAEPIRLPPMQGLGPLQTPGEPPQTPAWAVVLGWLIVAAVGALALLGAALLAWLFDRLMRGRPRRTRTRAATTVEPDGSPWQDAAAAAAALRRRLRRARRGDNGARTVRAVYRDLLAWGRAHHVERATGETPAELCERLGSIAPASGGSVEVLTLAYEAARYGEVAASAYEVQSLDRRLGDLRQQRADTDP